MCAVRNIVLLSLLAAYGAHAASNFRGQRFLEVGGLFDSLKAGQTPVAAGGALDWKSLALGVGVGAVVFGAIVFLAMTKVLAPAEPDEEEATNKEGFEAAAAAVEEEEEEEVCTTSSDYQALIKVIAQKVAQEVGPKVSKCAAVSSVLESRMSSFTDKAKTFLLNEMNGTAGAVLKEMDAPETMLLLDWDKSVEANFPPAAILIAGVLSPTVLNLMSFHHFVQVIAVGLPVLALCICAIVIDLVIEKQPCSIPTIYAWLFTQTFLALALTLGHGALLFKVWLGKRSLEAKAQEIHEQNAAKEGGENMRDEFVGNTVVLQEALLIENGIRQSFWNNVVGLATFGWVISTVWNLILVVGWTFVPGVVAFHPAAAEAAKGEYCGAWMTVLVMKINVLLAILFLIFNLATVVKWACDCLIESQSFQKVVLDQAKKMDQAATGLPVIELLAKAFLLRGGSDTLNSRLSKLSTSKAGVEKERAAVEAQLNAIAAEIGTVAAEELAIKATAESKGGEICEQVSKLVKMNNDQESWEAQGASAMAEAEEKALAVREATTKAIEELWEKIMEAVDAVQNSETAKALIAKAQEAERLVEAKAREAIAAVQDPEFLNKLNEAASQATAQAKELADSAIAAAKDPELQKKLNAMANDAMEQAQKAAEDVAAAANDPEKRKQLQEKAQQAMEQAQAAAAKAAADIQDPEMQRKMKEAAQNAMDQAQLAAQSAIAAAQDPELVNKLKAAADTAMEEAQALAEQAKAAANDPELKKKLEDAAEKAMKDAQEAAEKAKELATDPEILAKIQAAAKKQADQVQLAAQSAIAAAQDPEFLNKLNQAAQQATAQAKELGDSAIATAKDPELQKKLNAMANDAMEQAQKAAEDVAAAANDPEKRKQLQQKAQQAMEQAQAAAEKAAADVQDPEMQKKMKEAAQNAMDQAQLAAESAIAAAQDPELVKKLKSAVTAMAEAQTLAKQAAEASNDPELKKKLQDAADQAMKQAQEAAEKAKEVTTDPEILQKIQDAAKKQAEEVKAAAQAAAASSGQ